MVFDDNPVISFIISISLCTYFDGTTYWIRLITCIPLHFGISLHSHVWRYNETSKEILHLDSPGRGDSNGYPLILIFYVHDDRRKCRVGENAIFEII